jgi:hypothetical protein
MQREQREQRLRGATSLFLQGGSQREKNKTRRHIGSILRKGFYLI